MNKNNTDSTKRKLERNIAIQSQLVSILNDVLNNLSEPTISNEQMIKLVRFSGEYLLYAEKNWERFNGLISKANNDVEEQRAEIIKNIRITDLNEETDSSPEDPELAEIVLGVTSDLIRSHNRYVHSIERHKIESKFNNPAPIDSIEDSFFDSFFKCFYGTGILSVYSEMSEEETESFAIKLANEIQIIKDRYNREKEIEREKRRIEKEEVERRNREIISTIRDKLSDCPEKGWTIAFQLCGQQDTELTRKIRYSLLDNLSYFSLDEKITICEKYIDDLKAESSTSSSRILEVYFKLIDIILAECHAPTPYIAKYFDFVLSISEDRSIVYKKMIDLLSQYNQDDELKRWKQKLFDYYFVENHMSFDVRYLFEMNIDFNNQDMVNQVINIIDFSSHNCTHLIEELIQHQFYDAADVFIKEVEKHKKDLQNNINYYWLESIKYRLKYYRRGYTSFYTRWTPISFYDELSSSTETYITELKQNYANEFMIHREYLTDYELITTLFSIQKKQVYDEYIEKCEKEVGIIPRLIAFILDFRIYASKNKDKLESIRFDASLLTDSIPQLLCCNAFKDLAIFYQREGRFIEAISICEEAVRCGYENDGTKSGMRGRIERLKKKL